MSASHAFLSLIGRILLAVMFIMAGFGKFSDPAGTIAYMQNATFPIPRPDLTVYAVAALELFGGLALVLGVLTRPAAFALALFTIAAAVGFHMNFADQMQTIMFMKNLAVAGGLFVLAANGPGAWSVSRG